MKNYYTLQLGLLAALMLIVGRICVHPWAQVYNANTVSKVLFVIGVGILTGIALIKKDKVFIALQIKVLLGAVINAILPENPLLRLTLNGLVAAYGIKYALRDSSMVNIWERYAFTWGMTFLACGFGLGSELPAWRDLALCLGPWCVAASRYGQRKDRVVAIWVYLNLVTGLVSFSSMIANFAIAR